MKRPCVAVKDFRVWAALLAVAAAVLGVLILKALGLGRGAFALPTQSQSLFDGPYPETANGSIAESGSDDPYPAMPAEQVQWVIRNKKPAMVLVYSTLCRPCRMMDSLVQLVKRDYQPDVVFIEVLYDDPANAPVLRWARVSTIPASYFLSRSGEGKRTVGLMKQEALRAELARIAAADQD